MADPRSLRLIFEYDGDRVDLVYRQPVDMIAPSSEPLDDLADRLGSWVELRDPEGVALHRQVLHEPIGASTEVFSPDPKESLRRVERTRQKGAFTVVVPDLPRADQVAIVADMAPPPAARAEGAAPPPERRVLRFPLHDNPSGTPEGGHDDE
jgi:hypothetical protein